MIELICEFPSRTLFATRACTEQRLRVRSSAVRVSVRNLVSEPPDRSAEASADARLRERALQGERAALRVLVAELTPVVQARVARVLLRGGGGQRGTSVRQDVADLTQEIFSSLFEEQGAVLRSWRLDGGLSLKGFVGMVAEREALSRVRSRRRNPMTESPVEAGALELALGAAEPEHEIVTRDALAMMMGALEKELSPLGMRIFHLLFVEEMDLEAACAELQMSAEALYQWRTRIRKTARSLAQSAGLGERT